MSTLNNTEVIVAQVPNGHEVQAHIADIHHRGSGLVHLTYGIPTASGCSLLCYERKFEPPLQFNGISNEDVGLTLNEAPDLDIDSRNTKENIH